VWIANEELRSAFLSPAMQHYFRKKLPDLPDVELTVRIEETLKFLGIANHCTGSIPVSREIDEIWHYWILQTKEYESLCSCLPMGEFIHHSSNAYVEYFGENSSSRENMLSNIRMLAAYVVNYGPFEESRVRYWTLASVLREKCGWDILELNDWLVSCTCSPSGRRSTMGLIPS
jgi:hypothetical protein